MFKQFLHAVSGLAPGVLFTDADPAVNAAVILVFGAETIHLWCLWHILENLNKKFAMQMGPDRYAGNVTLLTKGPTEPHENN